MYVSKISPVIVVIVVVLGAVYAKSTDEQIIHSFIRKHLSEIPKFLNENRSINVKIKFKLNQIIDIDERQQILTTSIFFKQSWLHPHLVWDQVNITTVDAIRLLEKSVWIPDTYVINNADDIRSGFLAGLYVLVTRNGEVHWPIRAQLKTFCPMDIRMFPFDVQTCVIELGSWVQGEVDHIKYSFSSEPMNESHSVDLSDYTDNSDWILESAHMQSRANNGIRVILSLQRRSFYYIWILIVPFVMLTILSLLTFCMPSTSNEKLSLSLSVFMAFSMFMIMISERIPPSTQYVPLIGVYLATIMTMAATSILVTVLIINIYQHRGFQRPSKWVRTLCISRLAPLFNLKQNKRLRDSKVRHLNSGGGISKDRLTKSTFNSLLVPLLIKVVNIGAVLSGGKLPKIRVKTKFTIEDDLITCTFPSTMTTEIVHNNKAEWELIAVVLDNLSFYVFVVAYLLVYGIVFLTPVMMRPCKI